MGGAHAGATRGRLGDQMFNLLGVDELIILDSKNWLSYLYMWAAHRESHGYAKITLARSRKYGWISRGYSLAKQVVRGCNWCSLQQKKKVEQRLGDIAPERVDVGLPPWTYVASFAHGVMDLFGALESHSDFRVARISLYSFLG